MFSYILIIAIRIAAVPLAKAIRVMIMLRISGVLPILLIRLTQAIAITNRLLPVSSPLFTTEIMRRFDAMINVEQMIKKDFLFI